MTLRRLSLGQAYELGQGVSQNNVAAFMWFVAADQDNEDAVSHRDQLAKVMTGQIAEAQRLAQEWKPTK